MAGVVRGTAQCAHAAACRASDFNLYWKTVPGSTVFCVCVLLIAACLVWLGLLLRKGVKFEEDA